MAKILDVNPSAINLFQLETYPGEKCNSNDDTAVRYHNNDSWSYTCDDCGKHEPKKQWRKLKKGAVVMIDMLPSR
jgi:hypothetical protein